MYDPKTARFLQEDTYTGDPNDPLSLNLYTYCSNNPIIYWDPTGHSWKDIENFFKAAVGKVGKTAKAAGKSVAGGIKTTGKKVETFGKETAKLVKGTFEQAMNMVDLGIGWELNQFGVLDDETYQYYKGSTLKRIVKESINLAPAIGKMVRNVNDFISGLAVAGNNNMYFDRLQNLNGYEVYHPDTVAYKVGKTVGDAVSLAAGAVTSVGGLLGGVGGFSLSATGAGAVVGVPITAASTEVVAYGATIMVKSAQRLVSDGLGLMSGEGGVIKRVPGVRLLIIQAQEERRIN